MRDEWPPANTNTIHDDDAAEEDAPMHDGCKDDDTEEDKDEERLHVRL